jgi:hypothetical protein
MPQYGTRRIASDENAARGNMNLTKEREKNLDKACEQTLEAAEVHGMAANL